MAFSPPRASAVRALYSARLRLIYVLNRKSKKKKNTVPNAIFDDIRIRRRLFRDR